MAGELPSSNSLVNTFLGNVPFIDDPILYQALLDIHIAIDNLSTSSGDLDTGIIARIEYLEQYVNARLHIETRSADYTVTINNGTILIDASSNTVTISLPPAIDVAGREFRFKVIDNTFTAAVSTDGTETIDGSTADFEMILHETITLKSDGFNWVIV